MNKKERILLIALVTVGSLVGGAISAWVFSASKALAASKVVEAEEFRVVDANGKKLAELSGKGGTGGVLLLSSPDDSSSFIASVGNNGRMQLSFFDSNRVVLFISNGQNYTEDEASKLNQGQKLPPKKRWPQLIIGNDKGGLNFTVEESGTSLSMHEGKCDARLAVEEGRARLELSDKEGKSRAVLGACKKVVEKTGVKISTPESSLNLFNSAGENVFSVP